MLSTASLLHQLRRAMEQISQLNRDCLWRRALFDINRHETLPEGGSSNVILQLVIDHYSAEVEEVALGPGLVEPTS